MIIPVHRWWIPASEKGHYWLVGIFSSRDEMAAWLRERFPRTRKRPVACCVHGGRKRSDLCLGYVCFAFPHIGSGTVAHEMVHAAVHTFTPAYRTTINEERLAQLVDHFVSTFWKRWYRYVEPRTRSTVMAKKKVNVEMNPAMPSMKKAAPKTAKTAVKKKGKKKGY